MSPAAAAEARLAAARAEAQERRARSLRERTEALAAAAERLDREGDAYWERRDKFLGRSQRGKKLAQLLAHDIKNHLAVVKTNLEFAAYELAAGSLERQLVDEGAAMIDEAFRLTAELVEVEEVEGLKPGRGAVTVAQLFAALAGDLGPLARAQGVQLVVEEAGEATLAADPRLALRLLHNLAHNALVHARARTLRLRLAPPSGDGRTTLSIEDDGDGLPLPEAAALSGEVPGIESGGLAFCRAVVDALGGELWMDEGGSGSTIHLCIEPAAAKSTARAA